jgi:Cys-tRNA(Pro)/Cys-tRNA(Cys) deacylase
MDLEKKLNDLGVWYRFIDKEETTHTADASRVTGIDIHKITKNLVSKTSNDDYSLLIVPGDRKVDLKKAAKALNVKKVRLIPFLEAEKISGYPPGGTPSIGLVNEVKTVLEKDLTQFKTFFCGGGTRNKLLELRTEEIIKVSNAIIENISKN